MRLVLFGLLLILTVNAWGQSSVVTDSFSEGTNYASGRDFDRALKSFKSALTTAENEYVNDAYRARLNYNIGVCHFQLGQFDLAADQFKSAILLKADYTAAHNALNLTRVRIRQWRSTSASVRR